MAVTTFPTRSWSKNFNLPAATAAVTANYLVAFWTAPVACIVKSCTVRWGVAGAAGTLMLVKVPSGTAVSAGTNCLSATLPMTTTADTNVAGALHATAANYTLAAGDSLAWLQATTPTSCANFSGTVEIAAT